MKQLIIILTLIFISAFPIRAKVIRQAPTNKVYTVHTGSYSLDRHNLTQTEINNMIQAIVMAIPNANYIAIGTYLDYHDQIRMWASSIHNRGRHVFFRSAGYNAWQQRNGETYVMTPTDARVWMTTFVRLYPDVFSSGDIFEPVPDEPENGTYWFNTYGSHGIGTNRQSKDEFNTFLQGSITDANNVFIEKGISGVSAGYVFTNPSTAKDIIYASTSAMLQAVGTDNYPEIQNGVPVTDATTAANLMQTELNTWVVPAQPGIAKNITFGPSVYTQLTQQQQSDFYSQEFNVIKNTLSNLNGITVWQGGANDNPKSRLFDYNNGSWTARQATQVVNQQFSN